MARFLVLLMAGVAAGFAVRLQAQILEGAVVEDSSGVPVSSAELRFHKAGQFELAADIDTDRQGRFRVEGFPAGDYVVDVLKPNYLPAKFSVHVPVDRLPLRLVRYAVFSGRVTGAHGEAVPGRILAPGGRTSGSARIAIFKKNATASEPVVFREGTALADGSFRIINIPPGEYTVGLWYFGQNDGSGMQFYPDTAHPRVFNVSGGEEFRDINCGLIPQLLSRISGKVVPDEKSRFSVALSLPEHSEITIATTLTEKDGSFSLEKIPPGNYDLFVAGPEGGYGAFDSVIRGDPLFGRTRVGVAGDVGGISIPVRPGRTLKVRLKSKSQGQSPPGCPKSATVAVVPLEAWGILFNNSVSASFTAEATIAHALPPAKFQLTTRELGEDCYVAGQSVVDLSADNPPTAYLELAAAGKIQGTVQNAASDTVVILLDDSATRIAFPRADGSFEFNGLAPGAYRITSRSSAPSAKLGWTADLTAMKEAKVIGGETTAIVLKADASK